MLQCPTTMATSDQGSGNSSHSVDALHNHKGSNCHCVVPELLSSKIGIKSASCLHSLGQ